jgi:glyoxylase-like metal-dependent hydrolase (beta-lactamase superfamily II)
MSDLMKLDGDIYLVDYKDSGIEGIISGYLVKGDAGWLLVESGPTAAVENILAATEALQIKSEDLRYIAVTHIHLDHAGGAGALLQYFKNASIIVHPSGKRHLVDPTKLVEGARSVLGESKMNLWGEVIPAAEEKIIPAGEGFTIDLGNRVLEVWETPGHARHHLCFYDAVNKVLFSGDAAGIYQPRLSAALGRPFIRTTAVNGFDPGLMLQTLIRIALSDIRRICFTHFGFLDAPQYYIEQVIGQLSVELEMAKKYRADPACHELLYKAMDSHMKKGFPAEKENVLYQDDTVRQEWEIWADIMNSSVSGILEYLRKLPD